MLCTPQLNVSTGNAFEHLVRQYQKRAPEDSILGTEEEPVSWETLGLDQKVQILWQLCEWQLSDPARFRSLLTSESDAPSWVRSCHVVADDSASTQ